MAARGYRRKDLAPSAAPSHTLVDEVEAAQAIKVSVAWLRKDRATTKQIPFIKIGALVRYDLNMVLEALRRGAIGGRPALEQTERQAA